MSAHWAHQFANQHAGRQAGRQRHRMVNQAKIRDRKFVTAALQKQNCKQTKRINWKADIVHNILPLIYVVNTASYFIVQQRKMITIQSFRLVYEIFSVFTNSKWNTRRIWTKTDFNLQQMYHDNQFSVIMPLCWETRYGTVSRSDFWYHKVNSLVDWAIFPMSVRMNTLNSEYIKASSTKFSWYISNCSTKIQIVLIFNYTPYFPTYKVKRYLTNS